MALYHSKGRISEMSEVQSGTSKSGYEWQRMTLVLDIPGYQGAVIKQAFSVTGDDVKEVLLLSIGDLVDVSFAIYAREWNGKWYNNVELVEINSLEEEKPAPKQQEIVDQPQESLDPADNPDDLPF